MDISVHVAQARPSIDMSTSLPDMPLGPAEVGLPVILAVITCNACACCLDSVWGSAANQGTINVEHNHRGRWSLWRSSILRGDCEKSSPGDVTNFGNEAEMLVPAEQGQSVLKGQSCDPYVVFGNGCPSGF